MWKSLSNIWLFATLWTIESMELSRIESWSGEPFPSPGDLPNPGIEPRSPTLWVNSLPAEPQGKPKNTGMGSLPLLWGIFLTQESNLGLPHCRWDLVLFFLITFWLYTKASTSMSSTSASLKWFKQQLVMTTRKTEKAVCIANKIYTENH